MWLFPSCRLKTAHLRLEDAKAINFRSLPVRHQAAFDPKYEKWTV